MKSEYKGLSRQQRLKEYSRLKREFYAAHGWTSQEAYDAFIKRIVADLGI